MTVLFPQIASRTPSPGDKAVVAIPARNEAARIGACLDALAAQRDAATLTVLLLLNGCTDATEAVARAHAAGAPFRLVLRHAVLPPGQAHAGEARGRAMDAAAALLEREAQPDGLLLTTDADSQVAPDWLAATRAELRSGADAVAGRVDYDPAETACLPAALRQRMAQEDSYAALLAELEARLDPVRGDGWPRHRMASGASLAVRLPAYRRAGGLPRLPVGEDRALLAALRAVDVRVRHAPGVRAVTSCRTEGRATGGAADTLRLRAGQPGLPCDSLLEPLEVAAMRWRARATLRRLHAAGDEAGAARWAASLLLPPDVMRQIKASPFGALWQMAEAASPLLRPVPLLPAALPGEIAAARRLLAGLRPAAAGPAGSGPCGSASPGPAPTPPPP
ncbi:glycosyltransferase [Pseudoroseomonas wenyumeiae]|uniref:Glycosyltransferase n=2 Tax=Teichococcus wenyumeiae TaxID=2478470 RepID=A0ABX9VRW3_9PROT|nr:glycosyltransferase [Pseudoroseomonas wenyumeiae]RMI26983.1 glycosyltransferase [Pseudoroseomonas wenyumeiae]